METRLVAEADPPAPDPRGPVTITVAQGARGIFVGTATYTVRKTIRGIASVGLTRRKTLLRVMAKLRKNGHAGRAYIATVDGQVMRGTIAPPRRKVVEQEDGAGIF